MKQVNNKVQGRSILHILYKIFPTNLNKITQAYLRPFNLNTRENGKGSGLTLRKEKGLWIEIKQPGRDNRDRSLN